MTHDPGHAGLAEEWHGPRGGESITVRAPGSGAYAETLTREFEALGLSPYEARVQLALLTLGSGTPGELARFSDVPRTSTYQILEELNVKGLAQRVPGGGPAVWSSPSREQVFGRLEAIEEERLRQHKERAARVREMLDEVIPDKDPRVVPYVHVLHDPALARPVYEQLVRDTKEELLVLNKPPYSWTVGNPNPVVVEAVRRAHCRVLYQGSEAEDGVDEAWRYEIETYHAAGVEGRIVDNIPIKLAISDRRVALLTLADPVLASVGYPTFLLIEHPDFAAIQASAFERLWESARPYVSAAEIDAASGRGQRRRRSAS